MPTSISICPGREENNHFSKNELKLGTNIFVERKNHLEHVYISDIARGEFRTDITCDLQQYSPKSDVMQAFNITSTLESLSIPSSHPQYQPSTVDRNKLKCIVGYFRCPINRISLLLIRNTHWDPQLLPNHRKDGSCHISKFNQPARPSGYTPFYCPPPEFRSVTSFIRS
ncbi:hypothetical protein ABKN59_005265 [Abortiporus biennis]